MRTIQMLAAAALLLLAPAGLRAAHADTAYTSVVSDRACDGKTVCTLNFPATPAGSTLTIQHVSCGVLTKGESGSVSSMVLSTRGAGNTPGDNLTVAELVAADSNIADSTSEQTLFYVNGATQPSITITSSAAIIATPTGGCLITGTTSP